MMKNSVLAIFCASFLLISAEKARFDNYRVYSVKIEHERHLEALKELENYPNDLMYIEAPVSIHRSAELIVPPHKFGDIADFFQINELEHEIKINNLQELIDDEQPTISPRESFGWQKYYDLGGIYNWLDQILEQYPDTLTNYNYGTSYENRTIRAIKLSSDKSKKKPAIFIESAIHAREWISVATSTYILNELLTSTDPEIKEMVENYEWIFVPVVNIDGYEYTHTTNRMWRKTRQPHPTAFFNCYGADPNRNFDFHHSEAGSSTNPCSETYAGPRPNSEPEIKTLTEFIAKIDNLKLYMSFHSYSQLLLFPYGHTYDKAPNHSDMLKVGTKTIQAVAKRYGTSYQVGNIASTIYLASGSSIDWVYGTRNVSLTYTFEFRDKGRYGFILPANQIIPNSLEVLDGLKTMVKEAKALNYL